jgi:hypothetical protein
VKIKIHVFENFRFEIPAEMYRLALVGTIASVLVIAVIYSRGGSVATEVTPHGSKLTFQQPKDREQAEGEVHSDTEGRGGIRGQEVRDRKPISTAATTTHHTGVLLRTGAGAG